MIYMWQEEREPYYRFQTTNRKAAEKMKRREKFKLVGKGVNCDLWVFRAFFERMDIAKKALKTLSGGKVEFARDEEIFYSRVNYMAEREKVA